MKVQWMVGLVVAVLSAGCAPNYFSIGLPLGGPVGQRGAPLDPKTLAPCRATSEDEAAACVYYVDACQTKGLHTLQIQRVRKRLVVTAYCIEPNSVIPPAPSAAVGAPSAALPEGGVHAEQPVTPVEAGLPMPPVTPTDPGPM